MIGKKPNTWFSTSSCVGGLPPVKVAAASLLGSPVVLYGEAVLPFISIHNVQISGKTIRPAELPKRTILLIWHQNTYLDWVLVRKCPELSRTMGIIHDSLMALTLTLPASFRGFRMFVFTLRDHGTRVKQIAESFQFTDHIILHPDSGGPYFKLKPGLLKLVQEARCNVVPVAFKTDPVFTLGKTLKHQIPVFGSRVNFALGKPFLFADGEVSNHRLESMENSLNELTSLLGPLT